MAQRPAISPAQTTLSVAQPNDLEAIIAIEAQSFATPWSRAALSAFIGDHGFLTCHHRNLLVGYILTGIQIPSLFDRLERLTLNFFGGEQPSETVGHVMNLAVHPDVRSCGLGRHLLGFGLDYLRGLGVSRVELEVRINNPTAIRLYESEGFGILDTLKGYYSNGDDAFLMSKPL